MSKPSSKIPSKAANLFATFGYISICVQWTWLVVTLVIPLLSNSPAKDVFMPSAPSTPSSPPAIVLPDFVQVLFIIGAVIFAVAVSIYVVIVAPKTVGRAGRAVTQTSARAATKQLSKKRLYSQSAKRQLQLRITLGLKLILIGLPLLALLIPPTDEINLGQTQITVVGLTFGLVSIWWFAWQYSFAYLAKINVEKLW